MATMTTIGVLLASTRPNRIGDRVANWVIQQAPQHVAAQLLDLAVIDLPFLDEPELPAKGNYQQPHTVAWSKTVLGLDGMIIVTCEYNSGYPAPLKNAIDFLWAEWQALPVGCVGYGWGGARQAIAALDQTLNRLKMVTMSPVGLEFGNNLTEAGQVGQPNPAPEREVRELYAQLAAAPSPRDK